MAVWLFRAFRRKQLQMVCFNDIDSVYPLLLCLAAGIQRYGVRVYAGICAGDVAAFLFQPLRSRRLRVPLVLSVFLMSLWLFVIVLLAVLDDLFRLLSPAAAVFYLLGLASCCIFCYFFFILTTQIYIGYLFIAVFVWVFFSGTALIAGGIPLSLRQLRTKDRDERRLSALRGNQRVGIPFLPKGFVPLSAKTCNAVRCLPGWDVLSA